MIVVDNVVRQGRIIDSSERNESPDIVGTQALFDLLHDPPTARGPPPSRQWEARDTTASPLHAGRAVGQTESSLQGWQNTVIRP